MVAQISDLSEAEDLLEALEEFQRILPQLILMLKLGIRCKRAYAEKNGTNLIREV